jgi:hypothetical protein
MGEQQSKLKVSSGKMLLTNLYSKKFGVVHAATA